MIVGSIVYSNIQFLCFVFVWREGVAYTGTFFHSEWHAELGVKTTGFMFVVGSVLVGRQRCLLSELPLNPCWSPPKESILTPTATACQGCGKWCIPSSLFD